MSERLANIEKAAKACDIETIQNIIEEAGEENFNKKDLNKALLQTVQSCSSNKQQDVMECIRFLITTGASVDAEDSSDGRTALMIACGKGYIEVVDSLI